MYGTYGGEILIADERGQTFLYTFKVRWEEGRPPGARGTSFGVLLLFGVPIWSGPVWSGLSCFGLLPPFSALPACFFGCNCAACGARAGVGEQERRMICARAAKKSLGEIRRTPRQAHNFTFHHTTGRIRAQCLRKVLRRCARRRGVRSMAGDGTPLLLIPFPQREHSVVVAHRLGCCFVSAQRCATRKQNPGKFTYRLCSVLARFEDDIGLRSTFCHG